MVIKILRKIIIVILLSVIIIIAGLLIFMMVTEYRPSPTAELAIEGNEEAHCYVGDRIKIMSWNIGYGALGDNAWC